MRCMATTTVGTRCRREGAKSGDMRRYCIQHGREVRLRNNLDVLTTLFASYGLTEHGRIGTKDVWATPSGHHKVLVYEFVLANRSEEECVKMAEFELRAINKKKVAL